MRADANLWLRTTGYKLRSLRDQNLVWILSLVLIGAAPAVAQSAPELLEKGIYLEETAGRLDEAIVVYGRIITDATAERALVAEALLRLGMCYLEKGWPGLAAETFDKIFARYPEQEQLVARAREQMPDFNKLELLPAPWPDGEVARMTLKLASGVPVGAFLITADATEQDGAELWRFRARQKVFSDADNQALRRVFARRDDMAPVEGVFKHTAVGHFEARYGDGTVSIHTIGASARREEKLDGRVFDNEEGWHLFRRLPLAVGYGKTIKFLSPVAGSGAEVRIEIPRIETVTVPAGEFECYRMEFNAPQVFWFSTDPSRMLVKWEGSGVVAELDEVFVRDPGRESEYRDEELDFSVTLPPDWLFHRQDGGGTGTEVVHLLDPNAEVQARMEIRHARAGSDDCISQAAVRRKLEQARTALRDYELRHRGWSEREVGGWPAVSFAGNYRGTDHERVHYWTFIENARFCVDFTLKAPADRFETLRAAFDRVVESYEAPPPEVPEVPESAAARAAESVLADFHLAASQTDPQRFLEHLASDALFFGPDAADRFDLEALRERFSDVALWLGEASERHVFVSADETLVWFDERLDSGRLHASGVLRRAGGEQAEDPTEGPMERWQIVQYHAGTSVPIELIADLSEQLRAHDEEVGRQPVLSAPPFEPAANDPAAGVRRLLRDHHLAANQADSERYFGFFAPEAVVVGSTGRYTVARLRALLSRGQGLPTIPIEQLVYLSPDQNLAWFEELVETKNVGLMRGTGVLRKADGAWRLAHHSLTILVPRQLSAALAGRIDAFYAPS